MNASRVRPEHFSRHPAPGWAVPRGFAFSPRGAPTWLAPESSTEPDVLAVHDLVDGSPRVLLRATDLTQAPVATSREEELRRERQRLRSTGITSHAWAKVAPVMIVPFAGDVFARLEDGSVKRLTETPEPELDPKICDAGTHVAFVRGRELVAVEVATRRATALTRAAPEGVTRGQSDFNGQEEFDEPSGFWWSPDCSQLAYLEVDEREVSEVPLLGYRNGAPDLMKQRYPRAGGKNPRVRLGVISRGGGPTRWAALDGEPYLGRFEWASDSRRLRFQTVSRDQRTRRALSLDATSGAVGSLFEERHPRYVEFADQRWLDARSLGVGLELRGAHHHLRVRALDGSAARWLTEGDFDVTALLGVDAAGRALFLSTEASFSERQLYAVPLAGGARERLTTERGVHAVRVSEDGARWFDLHSALDRRPSVTLHTGAATRALPLAPDPLLDELALRSPRLVDVPTPHGALRGTLLTPRRLAPGAKHPAVVVVYGGPGAQSALDAWNPRLLWQHLSDRGFFVFQLDNRGSGGRGHGFESLTYGRLGELEVEDQVAGARWLAAQPGVDGTRLGIYGHSYGGYLAARAMLVASDVFHVGVAGSPVTDWSLYDTGYTERYHGPPSEFAAGYRSSALPPLAAGLRGDLLLLHAQLDENVHYEHTARLVDALVAADKRFSLMVFPGERHGYRSPAAERWAYSRVIEWFVERL